MLLLLAKRIYITIYICFFLVGKPIDLPKIENPTQEDIDKYHSLFMENLTQLFEENKFKYLQEPENKKLIID